MLDLDDVKLNDTYPCETERTTLLTFKNAAILGEIRGLLLYSVNKTSEKVLLVTYLKITTTQLA